MKAGLAAVALAGLLFGCGSDGIIIVSFTSGTINNDPTCRGTDGQFNLLDQQGLTVLVAINSNTLIFVGNSPGRCQDLGRNDAVNVRGPRQGDRVTAQSVQVQ
jgi:hypothetical protein